MSVGGGSPVSDARQKDTLSVLDKVKMIEDQISKEIPKISIEEMWSKLYTDEFHDIVKTADKSLRKKPSQSVNLSARQENENGIARNSANDNLSQNTIPAPSMHNLMSTSSHLEEQTKNQNIKDEDLANQLQAMLKQQKVKHYTSDMLDQMIEESELIQQWKSIPKARRERLTRKQLLAMGREATLAEAIHVSVAQQPKKAKAKVVVTNENGEEMDTDFRLKQDHLGIPHTASRSQALRLPVKTFTNEPLAQQQKQPNSYTDHKKKQKQKQIIVVRRDEETNEIVKTFVDKVKRKKLTKLKKAVLEKR